MSTTFNLRSWSIDSTQSWLLSIIHHCECRYVDLRYRRHSNFRSWGVVILNFTVIHHWWLLLSMCRSTMSTTFKSPIVVYLFSIIHHPSCILVKVEMSIDDVDDRWLFMLQIVTDREYSILLLSIMVNVDMLIDDRGCKNRHRSWLSLYVDRRSTGSTTDDDRFKKSNTLRQVCHLSQCTCPKNKIVSFQKIFGTLSQWTAPKFEFLSQSNHPISCVSFMTQNSNFHK